MGTWLVAGLGNPGPLYARHRHNVGYLVVEQLAGRAGVPFTSPRGLRADTAVTRLTASGLGGVGADAERVVLAKSRTFMNECGAAVAKVAAFHGVTPDHLVVVHDELDLDPGRLRVKFGGGDNGHNGLKSIRRVLGTGDFYRVRLGIGRPPGRQEPADWVLSNVPASAAADLAVEVGRAADAVESLVARGLAETQSLFNS